MKNNLFRKRNSSLLLKEKYQWVHELKIPMGIRLFFLLAVLVFTIVLGVIVILLLTGTLNAGLTEGRKIIQNEHIHISQEISKEFGQVSIEAVELSKNLSRSLEDNTNKLGLSLTNIHEHPGLLEKIISEEFQLTMRSLQLSKSSGVFFLLDATVNPNLKKAEHSKAGLYIKNMEPNIIYSSSPNLTVLRGFPSISRRNSLPLHAQWKMEFDISGDSFYQHIMELASRNKDLPLSKLYYWSKPYRLPNTSEEVMLCTIPLVDSKGNIFGACGFEISTMLFKLNYMPNNNYLSRLFTVLSPIEDERLIIKNSMLAGGYSIRYLTSEYQDLNIANYKNSSFNFYIQNEGSSFLGIHTPIKLYPYGSPYDGENWVIATMIHKEDILGVVKKYNLLLFSMLMGLFIIGIGGSFFLSKRFIRPINEGLDIIKGKNLEEAPRTKIPEIDDLIEFLALRNKELSKKAKQKEISIEILDEFLQNLNDLTPAERNVMELYIEGYTSKEVAEMLFLSINTIKTHNKHIYMKLDIASRGELLLYVNILRELGKTI